MSDACNYISIVTGLVGLALLVSEVLPFATCSRCNSLTEALGHLLSKSNCLISNKQMVFDNEELIKVVVQLKDEITNLTTMKANLNEEHRRGIEVIHESIGEGSV
jgi:hypothetical protein